MTKTYVVTWVDGRQLIRKVDLPKVAFKVANRLNIKPPEKDTVWSNFGLFSKMT